MRLIYAGWPTRDNQPSNQPAAARSLYAPPVGAGGAAALYRQSGPDSNTGERHGCRVARPVSSCAGSYREITN